MEKVGRGYEQRPANALINAKGPVCENAQGEVSFLHNSQPLSCTLYKKQEKHVEVVSSKTLHHKLKTPTTTAKNHPWRRYGLRVSGKPVSDIELYGAD